MELFLIIFFILFSIFISITLHEIGHFLACKIFHVNVKELSIGIGPKIFCFKIQSLKISIRLLPIFAYILIDSKKLINLYSDGLKEIDLSWKNKIAKMKNINSCLSKIRFFFHKQRAKNYKDMTVLNKNYFLLEDLELYKKNIIYIAGVFLNLFIFLIFYFIQYYGFNLYTNPYVQIGESFLIMFKNMVFLDTSNSTLFGGFIDLNNSGLINKINISLVIVNYLAVFNLMVFFYNLIPIQPLDGYKIFVCSILEILKIKINKKVETCFTIIGIVILFYIFITSIIANIRFS